MSVRPMLRLLLPLRPLTGLPPSFFILTCSVGILYHLRSHVPAGPARHSYLTLLAVSLGFALSPANQRPAAAQREVTPNSDGSEACVGDD